MHREYQPADMNHLRAHAFGGDGHDHHHNDHGHDHAGDAPHDRDHSGPYLLTAVLGLLLAGELVFGWLGWESWRAPGGVSLALIAAVVGGARIVYGALEALIHGRIGADVALAQACLAALVIGEPFVAAEVVFIALVGEVLEAVTFARTQKAIFRLLDQSPRTARVRRDGEEVEVPAGQVLVGDLVVIRPGERIPVDGQVLLGRSTVDQSALTGEPIPLDKGAGDTVYTGTLNQFGVIEVRAEKVGHETTFGQVLRLVADAQKRKAPLERTADRLARYFLPVVEVVAGLTLVAGWLLGWPDVWLRTVAVLVVACPCALILATPAAVLASMAWLARHGVLIKGGAGLERLAACDAFAFDKTGTLTVGRPEVSSIVPLANLAEADLLRLAATAESAGTHPLALAVARAVRERGIEASPVEEATAHPGAGVFARFRGSEGERAVLVGNRRLMTEQGVAIDPEVEAVLEQLDARGETPLIVAEDGRVVGVIGARDTVRPEAHDIIHDLKHLGINQIAILTGDRPNAALAVAKKVHVKTVEAELLPADKARWVEEAQAAGRRVAMVGDGINDAPALAAAHVGIALEGIGADLAAEAGDFVILGEPLRVLPDLVKLSRATVSVIRQNIIIFAFGLNAVAMASAALGVLGPVPAAILHQAGSLLVLLNAMRLLAYGDWPNMTPVRQLRAFGRAITRLDDRFDVERPAARLLARWRILASAGVVALVLVYATSGWTALGPGEVGLVRRFGGYVAALGPGLHRRMPPPFETVTRLFPERPRSLEIGFRTDATESASGVRWESGHGRGVAAKAEDEALLLTGDGRLVELAATAQYRLDAGDIDALRAYAFGVADPDLALRPLAESSVRTIFGRRGLEALLTKGRHEAERAAADLLRQRANACGLGLVVTGMAFQDVHPPVAVVDAYRDVSRAESDRERRANEALAHRAEALASARGEAAATVNRAEAYRSSVVTRASGAADAFRYLVAARSVDPALTDRRLYWEAVAAVLAGRSKLLLDPAQTRPRHLILSEFPEGWTPPSALVGPPKP